jgi:molybdopterin-containing oxidoreductase family membrane subunit
MIACEVLTIAYPGADAAILTTMTAGATAPLFWGEIILGLAVPFCLLVFRKGRESGVLMVIASVLVVGGVFFKRAWLLLTSFVPFNVEGAPGVTFGRSTLEGTGIWELAGAYAPTWVEGAVALGIIALAALLFILVARRMMKSPAQPVQDNLSEAGVAEQESELEAA